MTSRVTSMTNYTTLEYRDKIEKEQEAAINRLLEILPLYVTDYYKYKEPHLAIKTLREYIQDLYSFFSFLHEENPILAQFSIAEISLDMLSGLSLEDFSEYERWLMDSNSGGGYNSPTTIRRKKSSLRSFYKYLYASDKIDINPVAKIETTRTYKKAREDIRVLSDEERVVFLAEFDKQYEQAVNKLNEAMVLSQSKNKNISVAIRMKPAIVKRDKAIVYLFLGTGLRISELCAINCGDFVPKLKRINVIRKGEGRDKNKKRTDYVLLSDEVMDVLLEYIETYRDSIGPDIENYDALFISSKHTRITPRAIEEMVKNYADITLGTNSGVHPHVLRASFGSRYQEQFHDILATSEVLNHSSVDVTARHYLHRKEGSKMAAQELPIG